MTPSLYHALRLEERHGLQMYRIEPEVDNLQTLNYREVELSSIL